MNAMEGIPISVPQFIPQTERMTSSEFQGFNFQGNVPSSSRPTSMPIPYPRLDGHKRRITPIPISATENQPSSPAMYKTPDEIQRGASELI